MVHQIATSTGCNFDEALALMLLLVSYSAATGFLLVYHKSHPLSDNPPVLARNLFDGFPQLPFVCDICQEEIVRFDDLSFDFLFKIIKPIKFIE